MRFVIMVVLVACSASQSSGAVEAEAERETQGESSAQGEGESEGEENADADAEGEAEGEAEADAEGASEGEAGAGAVPASRFIVGLQIFRRGCFRWIADIRDRDYERQPRAIEVEVEGRTTRIPYVANEADTYLTRCLPLRNLGSDEVIRARFSARQGDEDIEETLTFRRIEPGDRDFVDIEPN